MIYLYISPLLPSIHIWSRLSAPPYLSGVRDMVVDIGSNISNVTKAFPLQRYLGNFTVFISHAHSKIEDYYPEIDQMDFYR